MHDEDRSSERRAGWPAAGKVGRCVNSICRAEGLYEELHSVPEAEMRAAVSEEWRVCGSVRRAWPGGWSDTRACITAWRIGCCRLSKAQ